MICKKRISGRVLLFLVVSYEMFFVVGTVFAQPAEIPHWQGERTRAIARIVSQRCIGPCTELDKDPTARVGTGFLTNLENFDKPVIVTALHVVAGANKIIYNFTEVDNKENLTNVLAIDLLADIALLEVDDQHLSSIQPLLLTDNLPASNDVIVYGYKEAALSLISDQGRIKLKSPDRLSGMPLGREGFAQIRRLGYPDLDLPIVGIEEALNPGDSGAPVFDIDGNVVGMAHGGIPSSSTQIAWMVPSSRIMNLYQHRTPVERLPRYDTNHVFASISTFYTREQQRTPFGTHPSVAFALEWPAIFSPLKEYASRLDQLSNISIDWLQDISKFGPYGGREILQHELYFPAASTKPYDCTRNSGITCEESLRMEKLLIDVFGSMTIQIECYRSEVFNTILTEGTDRYHQSDLWLEIPLGEFTKGISDGRLGLSFDWNGPEVDHIYLYSKSFIQYRPGSGSYRRHPDILYLEDLYGGACRIRLGSIDPSKNEFISRLEEYLRFDGACFHLILSPNTHTPVAFTSYLPLGENLANGYLWGMLPISHIRGTIDDLSCH